MVALSLVALGVAAPFATLPLPPVAAFIPSYDTALLACDFVTAVMLFGQFAILRSRAQLVLAGGYVFAGVLTVVHALTFPSLLAPTGLLGVSAHSTVWVYTFWHGGFPLAVTCYALLRRRVAADERMRTPVGVALACAIAGALAIGCLLTLLATVWESVLPVLVDGNSERIGAPAVFLVPCALALIALAALWRAPQRSVLDLWLMVVMFAWLLDVTMSAVHNAARFDLGFYVGHVYGLAAAAFVPAVLLVENVRNYGRLAATARQATHHAAGLEARVRERTAELEARTRELGYLFERSPLPRWVYDTETLRFLAVNNAALATYGYSREEFLAMQITDIRPHEDAGRVEIAARAAAPYEQSQSWKHRTKDGRLIDVDIFSHEITYEGRQARIVVALDVTDRNAARLTAERIFETSLDLILVTDGEGNFMQVSPSVEAILGYRPEQWVGRSAAEFLYPADLEATRAEMRAARRGRSMRNFRTRYTHTDGRIVTLAWTGTWSAEDRRHFFTGRDMTESLAAEERLRQSQKMEAVGQLTGGLAHDFNNLLQVIMGNLGLLRDLVDASNEIDELAREAQEAARRGADLTRSLLAFARRQSLQPQRADVNALVTEIVALLRRTLGERIEITLELAPDAWPIVVDPIQLEAALANLATNARDAMPKGGKLRIVTANRRLDEDYASQHLDVVPGDYTMLQVSDTGAGMSPEVLARIFEPFFTTKGRGEGTGLGLSMVFGFMKQSGGHINVYSEVGVGTAFRLYLPRDRGPADAAADEAPLDAPPGGGQRILVVEDNPSLRRLVLRQLHQLGYEPAESENATEALRMLEAGERFDLVFTDIVMAGKIDGFDLAHAVRARWPATRIVMTSGFPDASGSGQVDPLPDVRLLSKPYRKDELARVLRDALGADDLG